MRTFFLIPVLVAGVMAGCSPVGPDYKRVDPPVPARFGSLEKGISTAESIQTESLASWWKIFNDSILDSLMKRAEEGSLDLRIAEARVRQARALSLGSESQQYPEGGLNAAYQRSRRPESGLAGLGTSGTGSLPSAFNPTNRETDLYLVGFDASWEIDIFGGIRREIEAAHADLAGSEEARRDTLVTLQGEVARNYLQIRGQQLRFKIAQDEVQARKQNVELVQARFQAGLVNELDLARAKGALAAAQSIIPLIENNLREILHRLAVLLGQEPMSLVGELEEIRKLPEVPENLPAGLPSDLLRRRPDIRRTERELAAATARIGVSTAELFPKFSLTGSFGYQGNKVGDLPREGSNFWRIAPTFRWSILNFKRITADIEVNKAVREESLARFEKSVLVSLEEVENALVTLSREKRRAAALEEAVQANEIAFGLAMERYRVGIQSYLEVLDAETALYLAQDQLAQSRQNRAVALVSLYKALGGGWRE